jgi:phosphoribosylaminoimidazole-succinocarboxamide synthase
MKKSEALEYIRSKKGYVPYVGLFDIFEEDDEIPQELINVSTKEETIPSTYIMGSPSLIAKIEKMLQTAN